VRGVATGDKRWSVYLAGAVQAHQSGLSELVELIKLNGGSAVKSSRLRRQELNPCRIILLVAFVAMILVFGSVLVTINGAIRSFKPM
jgi:hypothetical protein